jgi:hypothetical protein
MFSSDRRIVMTSDRERLIRRLVDRKMASTARPATPCFSRWRKRSSDSNSGGRVAAGAK